MAEIKSYLEKIRTAKRGEAVRDSITDTIRAMGTEGINVQSLSGKTPSYFAKFKDINKSILKGKVDNTGLFDKEPKKGSYRTVTSGGMYQIYRDINDRLNTLLGEED